MAEATQENLLAIFRAGRLEIPKYQRGYAWNEKQVDDLIEDIEYIIERKQSVENDRDVIHYFGTIVLDRIKQIDSLAIDTWHLYEIVDGQQRLTTISLLIGCICEELDRLPSDLEIDDDAMQTPDKQRRKYRDYFIRYDEEESGQRLTLAGLTKTAYDKLVVSEEPPERILDDDSVLPAENLARAKQRVLEWITSMRAEYLGGDISEASEDELKEYYVHLSEIGETVSNAFEVTKYRVHDAAEAGRLFEVVNDRGKDLTIAEKVKSHLLYCAGEIEELDSKEIARKFNEAIETITITLDEDEETIDQFIMRHWEMFTGEASRRRTQPDIDELHRRIKQIDRYAPLDREPKEDLIAFIKEYISSLNRAADAFVAVYDPQVLDEQYSDISEDTINRLYSIEHSGGATNFRSLLMAAYLGPGPDSDEFKRLVRQIEVFAFRAYQITGRGTQLLRRDLKQQAHRLYVADEDLEEIKSIFGELTLSDESEYYESVEAAINDICNFIDNNIAKRAAESEFKQHLTKPDVISGGSTSGWGGFSSKKTIKYLLYEYERKLREEEGDTGLYSLASYSQFKDDCQIEHISPKNPDTEDARLDNHDQNCNRLANLAFLWPQDNKNASNDKYDLKYENTYSSSGIKILETLPEPSEGWDIDALENREEKLVKFCLDRWSGEKSAQVFIDEDVDDKTVERIREDIESHYKYAFAGGVPTVVINSNEHPLDTGTENVRDGNTCKNCNGVKMTTENDNLECVCGTELDKPLYQVQDKAD